MGLESRRSDAPHDVIKNQTCAVSVCVWEYKWLAFQNVRRNK